MIPFVVMTICSIIIILEIKSKSNGFIKSNKRSITNQKICLKSKRRNQKLSLMLLVNNLFFILCSLPLCLNSIYHNYKIGENESSFHAYFHILAYSNNSFNFIFYYIFSSKYQEIISLIFFKGIHRRFSIPTTSQPKTNGNVVNHLKEKSKEIKDTDFSTSFNRKNKSTHVTFLNDHSVFYTIEEI